MRAPMTDHVEFKACPMCGFSWQTRDEFLSDEHAQIIGYQACFERLKTGCLLFNHTCEGTFALMVSDFSDLYEGPVFQARKTGTDECPGHCLQREELAPCPAMCECASVREIIQVIKNWPKKRAEHLNPT